ncbi:MAG: PstS family phosphate ABC transporter substrate-binding protein [Leptolyngbyaceae cyanobacterium bins.59]|nr:PstS family phosphate ABC transporter substrate-binding protein [Leptolyngbyaceae cyanobacterium bins.59]
MHSKPRSIRFALVTSCLTLALGVAACGGGSNTDTANSPAGNTTATNTAASPAGSNLTGSIVVDGSSTVFPISEAMAEEFQKANSGVQVTVGKSGTGGGFKKFCAGETDISNASRPIKKSEIELCQKGGVEYVEVPISFDGLSVVVNPGNTWAQCLKVDELKKMWEPAAQGKITTWDQIRSGFPKEKIALYGPGTDSGTFDYFTNEIVGDEGKSRGDYTASEDDNVLVQGVAGDKGAIGYFGYAYYEENKDKLKVLEIDSGSGCVAPSPETIANGTYTPLSRPEFFYVKKTALTRPEVKAFVDFQLANPKVISEVGYVPLPDDLRTTIKARVEAGTVGSLYAAEGASKKSLKDLLKTP